MALAKVKRKRKILASACEITGNDERRDSLPNGV